MRRRKFTKVLFRKRLHSHCSLCNRWVNATELKFVNGKLRDVCPRCAIRLEILEISLRLRT